MSKILTEGPGAGYTISGILSDVIVNSFKETGKYSDQYGNYIDFELDATANFEDVKANSYEYGGNIESVSVKITKVSLQKLDINGNEDDTIIIDSEFIKESITDLKIKILYGAGWSHVKFDGIITASKDKSEISGNDYDWTNDCVDKITFNFVEQSDIDELDNLVTSDPYDFFDDEEDEEIIEEATEEIFPESYKFAAKKLFNALKPYGAIDLSDEIDHMLIKFDNEITDNDITLIIEEIKANNFYEVTSFGEDPYVIEFVNDKTATVCVKVLKYSDRIEVEVSKETLDESNKLSDSSELNINKPKEFIELSTFKKSWSDLGLTDIDLNDLQILIMQGIGAIPLGTNVYKIKYSPRKLNKGKDTAHRVIYIEYIKDSQIYLVLAFSKSDEANITPKELDEIRNISKQINNN